MGSRCNSRMRLKCDGTRTENRFRLSAKRTSPFKSAGGRQFRRLLADELCTSACRVCTARASLCSAVMWRLLVTHSILLFPLHFSRASPCAITFQLDSNARYTTFRGTVKCTGYTLHSPVSPSLPLPYITVCHHVSTALYHSLEFHIYLRHSGRHRRRQTNQPGNQPIQD
jgi:hypothetical protein